MIYETVQAFLFIIMAEMGDKTQMLAMAFATKYSLSKVLLGVFIGSSFNHGLAALLGTYLSDVIPINMIRLLAAVAFVGFGLWSLKIENDDDDEEEAGVSRFGPVLTVASAFFIGEIGDKTQLTVITLASQASYPLVILLGTVIGMVVTSALGVYIGSKLGKKIPEVSLKIGSATIFILFGLIGLREVLPSQYMSPTITSTFLLLLGTIVLWMIKNLKNHSSLKDTPYKKAASELYLNTNRVQEALFKVCQENKGCVESNGGECTIRCLHNYLWEAQSKEKFITEKEWKLPLCKENLCRASNLKESLIETINTCMECPSHQNNCVGNQTRKNLEALYFGKSIPYKGDRKKYFAEILKIDPQFFD